MGQLGRKTEKEPVDKIALAKIENEARTIGGDIKNLFLILRYTGMHPSVVCNAKYRLRERVSEDGSIIIEWERTKKEGKVGYTCLPKHRAIDFDINAFASEFQQRKRKRSRQYVYDVIKKVAMKAGYANVTPLSLRHSIAVEFLSIGVPSIVVQQILNVSDRTMKAYGKFTSKGKLDVLKGFGWGV